MHDPHFRYRPELLLSDVPGPGSTEHSALEELMENFDRDTDACCQRCGAGDATPVSLPAPYLLESHLYCPSCRAFAIADRVEAVTPRGGHTNLVDPGQAVTVWRTDSGLHLITQWGHRRVVSFKDRQPAVRPYPMPRVLEHYSQLYQWHSSPDLLDGLQDVTRLPSASEVLPGMTVGLASDYDEYPLLTPLEVLHGVVCTIEDVNDTGDFLIWVAPGAPQHLERAWHLHSGVATQLVEHGWDLRPTPDFAPSEYLSEHRGEVGVIRIEQALSGISGSRAGFDLFAPGWIQYLDYINIAVHDIPRNTVDLAHADVDPLSGRPIVRFIGVPPRWGQPTLDLRGAWRSFLAGCLSSCSVCGKPGHLVELSIKYAHGRVHRYLCLTHFEQENSAWNY
jgi:hypothetical protein